MDIQRSFETGNKACRSHAYCCLPMVRHFSKYSIAVKVSFVTPSPAMYIVAMGGVVGHQKCG